MSERVKEKFSEELVKELREDFDRRLDQLRVRVDELQGVGKRAVIDQPILSLGVALVLGLALGVALTRSRG